MLARVRQYANIQVLNRLTSHCSRNLQLTQRRFDGDLRYGNCAQLENVFCVLQCGGRALAEPLRRLDCVNQNRCVEKQAHLIRDSRAPPGSLPPHPPSSASTNSDRAPGSCPAVSPTPASYEPASSYARCPPTAHHRSRWSPAVHLRPP